MRKHWGSISIERQRCQSNVVHAVITELLFQLQRIHDLSRGSSNTTPNSFVRGVLHPLLWTVTWLWTLAFISTFLALPKRCPEHNLPHQKVSSHRTEPWQGKFKKKMWLWFQKLEMPSGFFFPPLRCAAHWVGSSWNHAEFGESSEDSIDM